MNVDPVLAVPLMGLAVALLVFGSQGFAVRKFQRDVAWVREVALRFGPEPPPAQLWVAGGYLALLGVLVVLLLTMPHPALAVLLWIFCLFVPRMLVEWAWHSRRQQIDMQIPFTVATMANSLRAGLTLVQAMQRLADTAEEPIRTDFQVMVNRYAVGANIEETILETKQRLKLANFNLFASALLINREMGGDIAETLLRISQSLDRLHQMRKTVEAHTSEGRTNIKFLLAAPFVLLMMLATVDSDGVALLFNTIQGVAVLTIAALLIAAGIYFASVITHSEI